MHPGKGLPQRLGPRLDERAGSTKSRFAMSAQACAAASSASPARGDRPTANWPELRLKASSSCT